MTTTDAEAIAQAVADLEGFINEPPQYEDQRMVRDYRHEAYRKWSPVRDAILSYLASRREAEPVGYVAPETLIQLQEPRGYGYVVAAPAYTTTIPLYLASPAPAGEVERMKAAIKRQVDNIDRWRATGESASPEESKSIYDQLCAALNGGQSSSVMAAAEKASKRIETWSDAKKDYANRAIGTRHD